MASYASAYFKKKMLDLYFGATAFASPATWYLALFTTLPASDGSGGVEVSGSNYSRLAVTNNGTNFSAATGSTVPVSKTTAADQTFATPSGSWGTVVGAGIYDASTSGNPIYLGALTTSKSPGNGDTVRFPAGNLTIQES